MTTEVDGVRHLTGFRTKDATIAYVAESEGRREGAGHASDIPYFFDTVDIRHQAKTTPRDRAMGKAMSAYLVNFARSGNPNDGKLPDGLVTAARRT